ncbi:hypothetical protein NL676_017440, partial [Syzygium grande]
MGAASLLRQRFNAYVAARDAWNLNEFNRQLTRPEQLEYYTAFQTAETNLALTMDFVRQNELLVLSTVSEASAFVSLLHYFLPDRGLLNRVQIGGNVSGENRAEDLLNLTTNFMRMMDLPMVYGSYRLYLVGL